MRSATPNMRPHATNIRLVQMAQPTCSEIDPQLPLKAWSVMLRVEGPADAAIRSLTSISARGPRRTCGLFYSIGRRLSSFRPRSRQPATLQRCSREMRCGEHEFRSLVGAPSAAEPIARLTVLGSPREYVHPPTARRSAPTCTSVAHGTETEAGHSLAVLAAMAAGQMLLTDLQLRIDRGGARRSPTARSLWPPEPAGSVSEGDNPTALGRTNYVASKYIPRREAPSGRPPRLTKMMHVCHKRACGQRFLRCWPQAFSMAKWRCQLERCVKQP